MPGSIDSHEEVIREFEAMAQNAEEVIREFEAMAQNAERDNMKNRSEGGKRIEGEEGVKDESRRSNMTGSVDSHEEVIRELEAMTLNAERVQRETLEDNMNKGSEGGKMIEGKEGALLNRVKDESRRSDMPGSVDSHEEVIREFEVMTQNAERVQRETLEAILQRNSGTEYLKKWGVFQGSTDPDPLQHFKSCVPVVCYPDLAPYMQRIADGDTSPILTADPITAFSLTYYFI